jgi:hypothetical protein
MTETDERENDDESECDLQDEHEEPKELGDTDETGEAGLAGGDKGGTASICADNEFDIGVREFGFSYFTFSSKDEYIFVSHLQGEDNLKKKHPSK